MWGTQHVERNRLTNEYFRITHELMMTVKLLCFSTIGAVLFTLTNFAFAGHWTVRCNSLDSGTDLGLVHADSMSNLTSACGKLAITPIVSNHTEIPCAVDDKFYGCESEDTTLIKEVVPQISVISSFLLRGPVNKYYM